MVASSSGDLYSPFHLTIMVDEGPQSSDEGSSLHSPVYDPSFPGTHGNQFRYPSHDIRNSAGILSSQFDYSSSLIPPQESPLIDTALQAPSHPHSFSSEYSIQPRNHSDIGVFPSPVNSRFSSNQSAEIAYFPQDSERRIPDRTSHDTAYTRLNTSMSTIPMEEQKPSHPIPSVELSETSTTHPPNNRPRDRRTASTVVIACRQCRSRKIKCDSARPNCGNCLRRSNQCEYDPAPKRRGPDKRPGTRQRSCKKRPADGSDPPPSKRKKTTDRTSDTRDSVPSRTKENMAEVKQSPSLSKHAIERVQDSSVTPGFNQRELHIQTEDDFPLKQEHSPVTQRYIHPFDQFSYAKSSFPRPIDVNVLQPIERSHIKFPMPPSPVVESFPRNWWDQFLNASRYTLSDIETHTRYLFSDTGHWLEFLHVEYFLQNLYHREKRYAIQPAFILATLAMSTLMKSSNTENGEKGRGEALDLRNAAHAALQTAWNSNWVDATLAEAALILALFESSVHPEYDPEKLIGTLTVLDNVIRALSLTNIDANDPTVSVFPQRTVPVVNLSASEALAEKCICIPPDAQHPPDPHNSWSYPLPWDSSWTTTQIRDEECRRVCWSALGLVANYSAQCTAFDREFPDLYLSDPSNYAILFPGEVIDRVSPSYRSATSYSPKESVWALYCRSLLLWSFCNQLRRTQCSVEDKAEYAQEALSESQFLQDALDCHQCNLDTALIYLTREYIYDTRISITQCLRSVQGLETRSRISSKKQAMEWILYQEQVIKRVALSIQRITAPHGHQLTRRPYQVTWFSNQLAVCLMLWNSDNTLIKALELAKSVLVPVDVMDFLWPCTLQHEQCNDMRHRLIKACRTVGIDPPIGPEYSVPRILRSQL